MDFELNEGQKKVLSTTMTLGGVLIILGISIGFLIACIFFVQRFSNIIFPLAVSGIIALLIKPYYNWWYERTGQRRIPAVALVYTSIAVPLLALATIAGIPIIKELRGLVEDIPEWAAAIQEYIKKQMPALEEFWEANNLTEKLRTHTEAISTGLQSAFQKAFAAGAEAFRIVTGLLGWGMVPIYVTLLLVLRPISVKRMEERALPFLKPETRKDVTYLAREFVNIMVAFFRGQILIALIQGVLFAIGFGLAGLKYGIILGFLVGLLNIIPYLGSLLGVFITFPLAFFQSEGGIWTLIFVVIAYVVVQAIEGNFLTPRIMGDRTGLHPLVIIVAILFWGNVFGGILGMILAIPLTAFLTVFWRLLREKYIQEMV